MTTSDYLKAARQELLTRGWCQGDTENPVTGEVCVMGAMAKAWLSARPGPFVFRDDSACRPAAKILRDLVPPIPSKALNMQKLNPVAWWNDEPGRTPEEVLALFDAAIALAEQREQAEAREAVTV